jgi:hypothetical protein
MVILNQGKGEWRKNENEIWRSRLQATSRYRKKLLNRGKLKNNSGRRSIMTWTFVEIDKN